MDDGHISSSSIAAAGLFNPFILKRRKLSWKAEELIPRAIDFYEKLEVRLKAKFLHNVGILRRIHDAQEYNAWVSLKGEGMPFIGDIYSDSEVTKKLDSPFGFQEVTSAGYVGVEAFLKRCMKHFREQGTYIRGTFSEKDLRLNSKVEYGAQCYDKLFMTIGYKAMQASQLFPDLPFSPAKGHTMEIFCPDLDLERMVNGPCFIIPLGKGRFRIGSTYSWSEFNEDEEPGEVDKLRKMFESFCDFPYEIERIWAGVRPATKDRRPLIGKSKEDERVVLFNGFGSRAIMLAPELIEQGLDHIYEGTRLWPEVDLKRAY